LKTTARKGGFPGWLTGWWRSEESTPEGRSIDLHLEGAVELKAEGTEAEVRSKRTFNIERPTSNFE
jgi:hypothetical protein